MGCFGVPIHLLLPAAVLAVHSAMSAIPAAASFKYLKPGMEATDFVLKTLDNREITLAELKRGPAALLVFWATWSPKSEPALREAGALYKRYADAGLQVVAVNVDQAEPGRRESALVENTVRDLEIPMPVAFDAGFAVSGLIGIVANPSLALLDARGVLVWDGGGWSPSLQDALREQVEVLLGLREPSGIESRISHQPGHKALLSFNLGRTFLRQGNPGKALVLFEAAAVADPAWAAPRTLLGHLLLQQAGDRDLGRAEALFRAAVTLDPGDVSALTGLGEALLRADRVEEAAPHLEKAQALDSTFTPALAGRARALVRQGQPDAALALFDAAIELNPRDAGIYAGRGACRELAGDAGAAAADYRRAVEIMIGAR